MTSSALDGFFNQLDFRQGEIPVKMSTGILIYSDCTQTLKFKVQVGTNLLFMLAEWAILYNKITNTFLFYKKQAGVR